MSRKFVMFRKWRLFWFGAVHAAEANKAEKAGQAALADAHYTLAAMAQECLKAENAGQGEAKLAQLEELCALRDTKQTLESILGGDDALKRMLDGTHEDVPDWLRKDK